MAKYGLNRVILIGNLGKDPEVKYLDQGVAVTTLTLATTERFRNKEGQYDDRTEWHSIVMWRGLAETAGKYLKKGSTISVEGRLVTRSSDGPDGNKRYKTEVEASNMVMLDSRPSGSTEYSGTSSNTGTVKETPGTDFSKVDTETPDDLPF